MTVNIEQFLSQILPAGNVYVANSTTPGSRKPIQKAFNSIRDLAVFCMEADAAGQNAFYAMAGFEKGWHDDPMGRTWEDGRPKKVLRTQANAKQIKAFWLDLDCGIGKDYASQKDALQAVERLCNTLSLPRPLLVNSGYGVHVYWPLDKAIPAASWKKLACLFAAVIAHIGIQTDAQCTADEARILRPVGTHNYKGDTPKEVKASTLVPLIPPRVFRDAVVNYAVAHNVKPIAAVRQESQVPANIANNPLLAAMWHNGNFQAVMGHAMLTERTKDADRIRETCEQVSTAGKQLYPNWFNMMTVMNCCPTGRDVAREISAEDPRHSDAAFFQKYDDDVVGGSNGPASCRSFDLNNPGTCVNCPYYGKIVTPAELGRVMPTAAAPDRVVKSEDDADYGAGEGGQDGSADDVSPITVEVQEPIAAPPTKKIDIRGFTTYPLEDPRFVMREGQGLVHIYEEKVKDAPSITKERTILDSCFYILYAVRTNMGRSDQQMSYMFQITNAFSKPRQACVSAKDVSSEASMRTWLFNNQLLPTPGDEKHVTDCMRTYLAKLQRKIPCMDMREHFGWAKATSQSGDSRNTFVLGERILSANQPRSEVALPNRLQRYSENKITQAGTLDGWRAVPKFYEDHNIIWGQFGIALAFAAPLMPFAPGIAKNGIVNFWSRISGTGKTTLQHGINSVWGHPEEQLLNIQSTMNSRFAIMGMRHNLPVCLNEITNLSDVELSEMLFQMSEGREKDRLTDGGKDMLASGSWSTVTVMSANNTVFDKMQALSRDRDGEIKRVLELEVDMCGVAPGDANTMTAAMNKNYGHAGEVFVQRLLDHPHLLEMVPKAMSNWVEKHIASQDERYWMNTIAAAVVAARLTNTMGLTNIDVDAIAEYALSMVRRMRFSMVESKKDVESSLNDYLADSLRDTLVVSCGNNANQMDIPAHMDSYVRRLPMGELGIRIEVKERLMYVRTAHLRAWSKQHGLTAEIVVKPHLADNLAKTKRMSVGVHSLPPISAKCWIIRVPEDMDLEKFTDAEMQKAAGGQAPAE